MALIDKLSAIADAIRGKTGGTDPLTLDAMAEAIAAIETGGGGAGGDDILNALIDRSVTHIESDATHLGEYSFRGCTKLVSAKFPKATHIEPQAFCLCSALKHLEIPKVKTTGNYAFQQVGLEEISMPSYTGTISTLFLNSTSLKKVDLGNNNCSLSTNGFNGCSSLDTLILRYTGGVIPIANINCFNKTPFASDGTGGTAYVPAALIEQYQQATNWSTVYAAGTCNFVAIEGSEHE